MKKNQEDAIPVTKADLDSFVDRILKIRPLPKKKRKTGRAEKKK